MDLTLSPSEQSFRDEFRGWLANKEEAAKIQDIRAEPRGHDDARYVITVTSDSTKRVVYAEFPGAIVDDIFRAGVKYSVKSKDESSFWPQVLVWWLPMLLLVESGNLLLLQRRCEWRGIGFVHNGAGPGEPGRRRARQRRDPHDGYRLASE